MSTIDKKISDIASTHLGKAGDGTVVKPYVTPDKVDSSLLVGVPRELNRTAYGIDENTQMYGMDVWHAYEVSFLLDNGFPVSAVVKLAYVSETPNIVESKSLKLYLNSFNMDKFGPDVESACDEVSRWIQRDLNICLMNGEDSYFETVHVTVHTKPGKSENPFMVPFQYVEDVVDVSGIDFSAYNEDPSIFEVVEGKQLLPYRLASRSLRSNCRVTNQPDWGDVFVHIKGNKLITPESFLQYVVSMRKENHFHEEICECIYKRLLDLLQPEELMVTCLYTRRGGIDINPVRATSDSLMFDLAWNLTSDWVLTEKTLRQ